jgi:uncharacterized protein DUF6455
MPNSRLLWPTREELRQRYEMMDRMMETRGVDVLAALRVDGGLAFIEARAKCRYCQHEGVCRHWLASEGQRGPADFCPNAAFFKSLIES